HSNSLCTFRAGLFTLHFTLRTFQLTLGFAHRSINMTLCITLCLTSYPFSINLNSHFIGHCYCDIQVVSFFCFISGFGFTLNRRCRTQRKSVLCPRYADTTVDVAEFDLWTTSTDLTVHTVSDVLTVFDMQSEVA